MKSKFDIYQLITPNIDAYAQYGLTSVYGYAKKQGYGHFIQRSQLIKEMHVNWSKIEMIRQACLSSSSEWIVLFDADLILINSDISLDSLIEKVPSNIHILMPRDTHFFKWGKPNAGLILLRRSQEGLSIVDHWLNMSKGEGSYLADKHPRNQRVYWEYVMPKFIQNQQLIPRKVCAKYHWFYRLLGHGTFAFHVTQTDLETRIDLMKRLLLNCDELKYLDEISSILAGQKEGLLKLL